MSYRFYIKNNEPVAMVSVGKDPAASAFAELLMIGKVPTVEEINRGIDVVKYLAQVK